MRKIIALTALVVGLAVPVVAYAADLNPNQADKYGCPYGGTWHFVNVQTDGYADPGELAAVFSTGTVYATADKVNKNVQHWTISATGTLWGASSDIPSGFIVLSDYSCNEKKGGS